MKKTVKHALKSKKGIAISVGETVDLRFDVKTDGKSNSCQFLSANTEDGRRITVGISNVQRYFGITIPSVATMEKWSYSGISKSVFGKRVEPDGWDPEGSPSWMLSLGVI